MYQLIAINCLTTKFSRSFVVQTYTFIPPVSLLIKPSESYQMPILWLFEFTGTMQQCHDNFLIFLKVIMRLIFCLWKIWSQNSFTIPSWSSLVSLYSWVIHCDKYIQTTNLWKIASALSFYNSPFFIKITLFTFLAYRRIPSKEALGHF